ncbi:hypothetical protein ASC64_18855 [Nocardioides sp. Root122]|uniref:baseplate J/gp47 family protein n=1 Tax=Nocardioides TaxID=1839 RepID=UPI0007032F79|nr:MULTISPECIES: baseplate J/gp47 family protein [Nocardioides]KQV73497.1 hypothetical protein ASC64_18855 [Nocardioides sp. Root122]MCK9825241.1 baseplate J/gp47 family protein [Nocardioides cavernae]
MPLFPPVTDTLRWGDLVEQGRSQLPLVAPGWTDQNTSDPGIALLELLAWLVEVDSYRSSAISDRERRLLLSLTGFAPAGPRSARALVRLTSSRTRVPAGLVATGVRSDGTVPLTLRDDVVVRGLSVEAVAHATGAAAEDDYRTGCHDLSREHGAGRPVQPFGDDPTIGTCLLVGLTAAGTVAAGSIDLWCVVAPGPWVPEAPGPRDVHHSVRTTWETWDGSAWVAVAEADTDDRTAAMTRSGRVRLVVPALPRTTLGDQDAGALAGRALAWLRCRIVSGRHDAPPSLAALHADVGEVAAAGPFAMDVVVPPGTPVTGSPLPAGPLDVATLALVCARDGTVEEVRFADPDDWPGLPAVDVVAFRAPTAALPGRLVVGAAVLGVALGVPDEVLRLPQPWCDAPPRLWAVPPGGVPVPVNVVADLAVAGAQDNAAVLEADGVTVRFGDGRCGATLPPGSTVLVSGTWTTTTGIGEVRPPLDVRLAEDARTVALLSTDAAGTRMDLVGSLLPGAPGEDVAATAARVDAALWVHDRLTGLADKHRVSSLDDLALEVVRRAGVPERAVTALDFERRVLATPGTSLWRTRALPDVDPRLPGLVADGCLTVAVVPWLPVDRPEPTRELLARVRADLASVRTLGTRVFVVGPSYVRVGVTATVVVLPGGGVEAVLDAARDAVDRFLHPVTGGPAGRGWPFGRPVRRSEVLQLLDQVPGVDRVEGLVLRRERADGTAEECGDLTICATELVLAGSITLTPASAGGR